MSNQPQADMTRGWRGRKRRKFGVKRALELRDKWPNTRWRSIKARSSDLSDGWEWQNLALYIRPLPCLPIVLTYSWLRPWARDAVDHDALAAAARNAHAR